MSTDDENVDDTIYNNLDNTDGRHSKSRPLSTGQMVILLDALADQSRNPELRKTNEKTKKTKAWDDLCDYIKTVKEVEYSLSNGNLKKEEDIVWSDKINGTRLRLLWFEAKKSYKFKLEGNPEARKGKNSSLEKLISRVFHMEESVILKRRARKPTSTIILPPKNKKVDILPAKRLILPYTSENSVQNKYAPGATCKNSEEEIDAEDEGVSEESERKKMKVENLPLISELQAQVRVLSEQCEILRAMNRKVSQEQEDRYKEILSVQEETMKILSQEAAEHKLRSEELMKAVNELIEEVKSK
mmetsp:Transcript_17056/g.25222  ORF Transcript_17056/g.25222 Transcript_17056/m.25222 type:complete len:301 (+) Transcript_17056:56-958(+)